MSNTPDFESIKQISPYGIEYWSARDLAPLLGYQKWERFEGAIKRAMIACENTGNIIDQHFPSAGKTSPMPHGGFKEMADYSLSRFACYLIAQNGDPRKKEIAANEFRITQAEGQLRREGSVGEKAAIDIHHKVGKKVRSAIEDIGGTMPEDLPAEPSIKPLLDEGRRKKRKQVKPSDEQGRLF